MALWIGRRIGGGKYEFGQDRDDWQSVGGFCESFLVEVLHDNFEILFKSNIKLKPGEVRKIKSITIELEE